MKVWITFNTLFSLQSRGLGACRIWFNKPEYVFVERNHDYQNLPFGGGSQKEGLEKLGWRCIYESGSRETNSISLGYVFGYESDLSNLVWKELCSFFKSEDLRIWDKQAKELKLQPKDFIFETEIKFELLL